MATIKIKSSDPATGYLELVPDGKRTRAKRKETIIWKLMSGCGVRSITNIYVKPFPPSTNIFSIYAHRLGSSDDWGAQVDKNAIIGSEWHYSIFWLPDNGSTDPIEYDPIISIRPTFTLKRILILLVSAILAIFSIKLLSKKARSRQSFD